MVVLALETVTPQGSVAVWHDGMCTSSVGDAAKPHATRLPGSWMAALAGANLDVGSIDRLAVVTGPGSFTGVRIGIASVQGLALSRSWAVVPVPTLDAMAECWRLAHEGAPPQVVISCLDGLRGEIFAREFHFDGTGMHPQGDPVVTPPDELQWTPFGGRVSLVGSGAVKYAPVWHSRAAGIADVPAPIASGAAALAAAGAIAAVSPHALRPIYVRRPDVELARERGRRDVR